MYIEKSDEENERVRDAKKTKQNRLTILCLLCLPLYHKCIVFAFVISNGKIMQVKGKRALCLPWTIVWRESIYLEISWMQNTKKYQWWEERCMQSSVHRVHSHTTSHSIIKLFLLSIHYFFFLQLHLPRCKMIKRHAYFIFLLSLSLSLCLACVFSSTIGSHFLCSRVSCRSTFLRCNFHISACFRLI